MRDLPLPFPLPMDVLKIVFQALDSPQQLGRVMLVSREWRSTATADDMWDTHEVTLTRASHSLPTYAKDVALSNQGIIGFEQSLRNWNGAHNLESPMVESVTFRGPYWAGRVLPWAQTDHPEPDWTLLYTLQNLKHLYLWGNKGEGSSGSWLNASPLQSVSALHTLQSLTCAKHDVISDADLEYLTGLTCLSYLDISDCWQLTPAAFEHLVKLPRMHTLHVTGTTMGGGLAASALSMFTQLHMLNCSECELVDEDIAIIPALTNLTGLVLSHNPLLNITPIAAAGIGRLTNLKHLDLEGTTIMCNEVVLHLMQLTQLTALKLDSLDSCWLSRICTKLSNLKALSLTHLQVDTDPGSINDIKGLEGLEELELDLGCCEWDGPITSLTNLTHLMLFKKSTDQAACISSLRRLQHLELCCSLAGPTCLVQLSTLTDLRFLDLSGYVPCLVRWHDAHHVSVLSALTRLTALNMARTGFGREDLPNLACINSLRSLCLDNNFIRLHRNELGTSLCTLSRLVHLEHLSLVGNQMRCYDIPGLTFLTQVTALHLENNLLTAEDMLQLTVLTNLRALGLRSRFICDNRSITRVISAFPLTCELDLRRANHTFSLQPITCAQWGHQTMYEDPENIG